MTGTGTRTRTTRVTTIALLVLRTGELKIIFCVNIEYKNNQNSSAAAFCNFGPRHFLNVIAVTFFTLISETCMRKAIQIAKREAILKSGGGGNFGP